MSLGWLLPLAILMQTRAAGVPARPVTWAVQSPRPASCLVESGLWGVSRQAQTQLRCRELARAQALLFRAPEQALARATELAQRAPEWSEARVLRGRASLRVGNSQQALQDLLPLVAEGAARAVDPATLQDGGRAALQLQQLETAERFYRQLGSGAALLPDRTQQTIAYIEIAATLLAGPQPNADEVLAYLREARRRSAGSGLLGLVAGLTALAWAAVGRDAEGQGALSEVGDVFALEQFEKRERVWLPASVFHAMMGLALERVRFELAVEHYRKLSSSEQAGSAVGKLGVRAAGKRGAR